MRFRRTRNIQLSPIKEIELAAARVPGAVSLAQGIPSFDTPEVIKAYVKEKLDQGVTAKYSLAPGLSELRELVADSLLQDGMRYDPDGEILITAGSIEAISASLIAITEPGDEVILPTPSYASYQQAIRIAGCVPRFAPLDEEHNFDLDVEAIAALITPRTAAIFYCNPNNPTGTIYSREQSLRMMELAERHDLMIITDEVYKDFLFTDAPYFSPAQVEPFRNRVVRIFSMSKAYAMTGWRVAYLHSAREVVTEILKVHDALVTCAPVISQHAAVAALEYGGPAIAEFRAVYRRRRDLTLRHLDSMSHIFDYQKPSGAYFVFPRVKDPVPLSADSRRLALHLLERAGVALVPGIAFGPTGESHLRLSFGREDEEIEEAFRRMRDYFGQAGAALGETRAAPGGRPAAQRVAAPSSRTALRRRTRGLATWFLGTMARLYLWRHKPLVVAIAGNRGKTVFKRTLSQLLQRRYNLRANPRSYNTEIGLPLAVLGLEINPRDWRQVLGTLLRAAGRGLWKRERLELLVLELGVRRQGDMAALLRIVRPAWAVVTPLAIEAEAEPGELDALREEMGLLCAAVPPGQVLLSDDALLAPLHNRLQTAAIPFGSSTLQPVEGGHLCHGESGCYGLGAELVGESAQLAAQAAVLLGERLGLEPETLAVFLRECSGPPPPEAAGKAVAAE